jgi:ABC-type phosphate/phosphonate transport system substrate-binding protein
MGGPVRVGAVLYDPKVSVIWEVIRDFFESRGAQIDVTFYDTYELQVSALLDGTIQVAWNSPLAWLDAQRRSGGTCRAIAMRDTDRDRVSHIVARKGGPVIAVPDLRSRVIAVGAFDSPQATLIPLGLLRSEGLEPWRDVTVRRFDRLIGKHGDHVGGELDAFHCLRGGEAAACAMLDLNWDAWTRDGTIDPGAFGVIASTRRFDHCVFTVGGHLDADAERQWLEALFSMRYDEPRHREMMDLEGLKAWLPGRTTGFQALTAAVAAEHFFEQPPLGP